MINYLLHCSWALKLGSQTCYSSPPLGPRWEKNDKDCREEHGRGRKDERGEREEALRRGHLSSCWTSPAVSAINVWSIVWPGALSHYLHGLLGLQHLCTMHVILQQRLNAQRTQDRHRERWLYVRALVRHLATCHWSNNICRVEYTVELLWNNRNIV